MLNFACISSSLTRVPASDYWRLEIFLGMLKTMKQGNLKSTQDIEVGPVGLSKGCLNNSDDMQVRHLA